MSAITGIVYLDGRPVERARVEAMTEALARRGGDGGGVWTEGSAGLGHRLLSTVPESLHEKQPLASASGDLIVTAEARLDNREELIAALNMGGLPHNEITDARLILMAYEKWGDGSPEKLLGDFAFAIWDQRERRLFCARDLFGVKPFYYHHAPGRLFAFGSEIKALLTLEELPRSEDIRAIAGYLAEEFEDQTVTFFKSVSRLPPAHCLTVDRDGLSRRRYWSPDPANTLRLRGDDEYAEAYRSVFMDAVRSRMRGAFPIGSMLSGGLDSSPIACAARDLNKQTKGDPLPTFSAIFDDVSASDERPFINSVIEQGGIEPHLLRCDTSGPLTDLDAMLDVMDEPFYNPNLFLYWTLWSAARERGVRLLLDGQMGDAVATHGYAYLDELAYRGRWIELAKEMSAFARLRDYLHPWRMWARTIWKESIKPRAPRSAIRAWRTLLGRADPVTRATKVLKRDFLARPQLREFPNVTDERASVHQPTERLAHLKMLTDGMIATSLEVLNRGISAFGLEPGLPYLDRRLVEFFLSLPPEQKFRHGWNRWIVRNAFKGLLPEKIRTRVDKGDLGHNFDRSLRKFDLERLNDLLRPTQSRIREYVDSAFLDRTLGRFSDGRDNETTFLWSAAVLETWLRRIRA